MKITTTPGTGSALSLLIKPEAKELETLKKHVLGHFKDQVKIPGFRPGTAPESMIEKNVDQNALQNEFLDHAVNQFYNKAVEIEKIRPLGKPQVQIKKFVPYTELEFEVELEALGPIILPDYKSIKVAKKPVKITANEINEVIKNLRQRVAERKATNRQAKAGDELVIDFDGYDKSGKAVLGASAKNSALILGSKTFIPGFEDALIGARANQELEFNIKFPADYGVAGLASQNVDFKIKVHTVNEILEPKLDDDFAKKAGPVKNLAELKADIKKQLIAEREAQATREYENEIVREITAKARLEVPKGLVDEEITRMEDEEKRNLTYQGQTWEEHLKAEKITEEEHRERQRPQATERVKGGLVLSEIAEKEKITATKEEVDERIESLKTQYQDQQMREELDKEDNRNNIVSRLLTEKTLSKLIGYSSK